MSCCVARCWQNWQLQSVKLTIEGVAGDDQCWAGAIINKVAPHVPVSAPVVRTSAAVTESLVKINVSSAKLLTRFLTSSKVQVLLLILASPEMARPLPSEEDYHVLCGSTF